MNESMPSQAEQPMLVNCIAYGKDGRKLRDITLDEISDFVQDPDAFVWVGLHEPDEALLEKLQEEFGLHDLAIEDAHNAHQRPKVELYDDSLFIALHTAQVVGGKIVFGETHLFVGRNYLVTVRHGASLSLRAGARKLRAEPRTAVAGTKLTHCIRCSISSSTTSSRSSTQFKQELHELEKDIFEDTFKRETVERLYLAQARTRHPAAGGVAVAGHPEPAVRLHRGLIREEMRPYLRDVFDHAARINDSTDAMGEMLTAAMSVNLAMVTVGAGRGRQAPGRLGRSARRAYADRQLVRHEFPPHAGTRQTLRLSAADHPDGRDLRGPVLVAAAFEVAVNPRFFALVCRHSFTSVAVYD